MATKKPANKDHGSRGNFIALALGQVGFRDTPEAVSDEEALKARKANFDTLFGVLRCR